MKCQQSTENIQIYYIAAIRSSPALNAQPVAEGFQNNDDRNFDFDRDLDQFEDRRASSRAGLDK